MANDVVQRELIADGKIIAYRFESVGTEAAEEWFEDITNSVDKWDESKPLLMLLDLSKADNVFLSADAMARAREVAKINFEGKSAILVNPDQKTKTLEIFLDNVIGNERVRDLFHDEAEAIAWLLA